LRSRLFPWAGVVALVAPGQRRQHTGTGAAAPGNKSNGFLQPFPKKRNSRESAQDRCSCCRAGPACSQCAGASSGCRRCRSRAWPLLVRWCCRCCRAAQDLAASRALALRRCRCGCRPLPLAAMAAGPRAGAGDRLSRVRRVPRWWRRGLLLLGLPPVLLPVSLGAANGAARVVGCVRSSCLPASTQRQEARQRKQRSSANPLQKKKTQEKPAETRCRRCRAAAGAA
jgi:hypothetical protein